MILFAGYILCGCSIQEVQSEKVRECDFTVVDKMDVPKELQGIIDEKKKQPFKLSYGDAGYLYLVMGYGEQTGGGYSITVDSLYETETNVVFHTTLVGPKKKENTNVKTYPYIVIKMEFVEKDVVYQ